MKSPRAISQEVLWLFLSLCTCSLLALLTCADRYPSLFASPPLREAKVNGLYYFWISVSCLGDAFSSGGDLVVKAPNHLPSGTYPGS